MARTCKCNKADLDEYGSDWVALLALNLEDGTHTETECFKVKPT